jgi:hypothetical protein
MALAERRLPDGERALVEGRDPAVLSPELVEGPEVVQRDGDVRMALAEARLCGGH